MNSLRVLTRFMHVQSFFLILLGVYGLSRIPWKRKGLHQLIYFLLPLLVIADNLFDADKVVRTEKSTAIQRVEHLCTQVRKQEMTGYQALAYLPDGTEPVYITQMDMMLAAQELGIPTVNGYSSNCPPAFGNFFLKEDESSLREWLLKTHTSFDQIRVVR